MGGCLSSKSSADDKPCAFVVSANGELLQFPLPIYASQILQPLPPNSFFLCNSDALSFNDYIPSLKPDAPLDPRHVYFVLPNARLQHPLAAADMAALAVKASAALEQITRRRKKTRISPLLVDIDDHLPENPQSNHTVSHHQPILSISNNNKTVSPASGSVRKLTRYSSQRAKLAVSSFKMKLTTIYEGSVLHPTF